MNNKPKILLVIDKPNWAYDHIANMIINGLNDKYDFYKEYQILKPKTWKSWIVYQFYRLQKIKHRRVSSDEYDLCIYFWWKSIDLLPNIRAKKYLVGIFTEGFPPGFSKELQGLTIEQFYSNFLSKVDGIICGNENIKNFYREFSLPVYYATCATNIELFQFNRKKRIGKKLKICWTGNPNRSFKGFYDYVEPAVKIAQKSYPDIELVTRFKGPIKSLPKFYEDVDLMVNASIGDAGPSFLLDAGACGVPSISTNVGFASELINNYENGLMVKRDVQEIANKIIEVYEDRVLLAKMSRNISSDVCKYWGYDSRIKYWERVFSKVLEYTYE